MKTKNKFTINFHEEYNLSTNLVASLVLKVVSDRATRKLIHTVNGAEHYSYSLHTESVFGGSSKEEYYCDEGLYEVLTISHWGGRATLQWNIYLILVDDEGNTYLVGEYLDSPDTQWVRKAKKVVKAYFAGEELDVVEQTPQPKPKTGYNDGGVTMPEYKKETPRKQKEPNKKTTQEQPKKSSKNKKGGTGRPQEKTPLEYGQARLMTFTGMIIGVYKITRHSRSKIEVQTDKGLLQFSKEDGKQINAKNPRYANKIEWNLDKKEVK